MPKELVFEEEARACLQKGVGKLADAACVTLGPRGRNVGLDKSWGAPKITNDGKSIVSDIELRDQYEDMGAQLAKQVANQVKEVAGDGTTSAILLLRALVDAGMQNVTAGASPIEIKRGMDKGCSAILEKIESLAIPVKSFADKESIATISASGNAAIGKIIAEAMEKVSDQGAVTIEEGKALDTELEVVEGMRFDRGYLSPYFINTEESTCEMEHPAILLADQKIASIQELLPVLQGIASSGRPLLIIAEDVEASALATLVINKLRGTLKVCAIKAPSFGDKRTEMLYDLGVLSGGKVFSEKAGDTLQEASVELLGTCERVVITKDTTTIVGGAGGKKEIEVRVSQLEHQIKEAATDYDKKQLEERRAKLKGGVAVIRVGGVTEQEMKQSKQLMQDALSATRAAIDEGTVVGGGVALLRASAATEALPLTGGEALGAKIVAKACTAPLRQLAENGGFDGSVVMNEVLLKGDQFGFNADTGLVEDIKAAGILDPAKVVTAALVHAVSSAGVILLSEVLIGEADEES